MLIYWIEQRDIHLNEFDLYFGDLQHAIIIGYFLFKLNKLNYLIN